MDSMEVSRAVRVQVYDHMRAGPVTRARLRRIIAPAMIQAVQGQPEPERRQELVTAVARGAMEAYLLLGKDMSEASVELMHVVVESAETLGLDTPFLMRWSLVGVAQAGIFSPPGTLPNMQGALESEFLGVGQAFDEICRSLLPKTGSSGS